MQCISLVVKLYLRRSQIVPLCRQISLCSALHSKSANNVVRRFLINNNETKKRKKWHPFKMMAVNPSILAQPQTKGEGNTHRLHVLNKVFMDKICDLMSTGENSSLFTGYGLEISKVQVLPSMTGINVYWYCTGSNVDDKMEEILQENTYALRHELSQQRVIGSVPPIRFVKDKHYYKLMEVDRRLAIADFGEDFEPTNDFLNMKSSIVMKAEFGEVHKNALRNSKDEELPDYFLRAVRLASSQSSNTEELVPDDLPSDLPHMSDCVLGVDTKKIFNMVRQGMTKARAEHRKNNQEAPVYNSLFSKQDTHHHTFASRKEEIRDWASKYEQLRKKKRRNKNKEQELMSVAPVYVEDDFEDREYEEEVDMYEEDYELNFKNE